ncbi:MAG: helix-turn-helix domain-containing protein [Firmicutes bacterium]|nr:helix-turn-helix domain-containing protein [Bacillota bacterium]
MDMKKIGKQIQKYRDAAGVSQEKLAEQIGVSAIFISYIERGTRQPSLENFINIANALKVSTEALLIDVLDNSYKERASSYLSRIEEMPPKDRQRILAVLEAMLSES